MTQSSRMRKSFGVKRNKGKKAHRALVRKPEKTDKLQELCLDKRIILKWVLQTEDTRV
jgi:hypothetical protein